MAVIRPYKSTPPSMQKAVLERDGYTCQECGIYGVAGSRHDDLQAHHIVPYRHGGEHEMSNLLTLCVRCHKRRDRENWIASMQVWQKRLGYKKITGDTQLRNRGLDARRADTTTEA